MGNRVNLGGGRAVVVDARLKEIRLAVSTGHYHSAKMSREQALELIAVLAEYAGVDDVLLADDALERAAAARAVADILETVDGRCMAADGPTHEITDDELRRLYAAARKVAG